MSTLGICVNTEILASTQYAGFDFNSACLFNGKVLLAGTSGIFTHEGVTDNETAITAYLQLPSASGGTLRQKRFRKLIAAGYFAGQMTVTIVTDEDIGSAVTTVAYDAANRTIEFPLNYIDSGALVGFKFANVGGSDFSLDFVQGVMQLTVLTPKTTVVIGRGKFSLTVLTVGGSGS